MNTKMRERSVTKKSDGYIRVTLFMIYFFQSKTPFSLIEAALYDIRIHDNIKNIITDIFARDPIIPSIIGEF